MEDQDNKITQYLIPANVSTRFEFFEGFGWYELKIVVIACLIGTVIFFGLGLFKKTTYVDINGMPITTSSINNTAANTSEAIPKEVPVIPTLLRLFAIVIPGAAAFFFVKRDPHNGMSLMFMYKSSKVFKKRQKRYLYKYGSGTEV